MAQKWHLSRFNLISLSLSFFFLSLWKRGTASEWEHIPTPVVTPVSFPQPALEGEDQACCNTSLWLPDWYLAVTEDSEFLDQHPEQVVRQHGRSVPNYMENTSLTAIPRAAVAPRFYINISKNHRYLYDKSCLPEKKKKSWVEVKEWKKKKTK